LAQLLRLSQSSLPQNYGCRMHAKRSNPAVKTAPLRSAGTPLKRRPLPLRWGAHALG
jgi:hypothetical protein